MTTTEGRCTLPAEGSPERALGIDELPTGVLLTDTRGRARAVNQAWQVLSGLDAEPSADHGWLLLLDECARRRVQALIDDVIASGGTRTADLQLHTTVPGRARWTRWWVSPSADHTGEPTGTVIVVADIDDEVERRSELEHRAIHDPLTGLANRARFFELTDRALRDHARDEGHLAVLYIDLDRFKAVNDHHGHSTGDAVLRAVASALSAATRPGDVLARVGGDEFAVTCDHLAHAEDAGAVADRIHAALGDPLTAADRTWDIDATIGIAVASRTGERAQDLLDRADRAMYDRKGHGARR